MQQRLPGYLIPVPCETQWVRAKAHPPAAVNDFYHYLSAAKRKPKHGRVLVNDDLPPAQRKAKRQREEERIDLEPILAEGRLGSYSLPLNTPANVAAVMSGKFYELDNDALVTPAAPIAKTESNETHRFGRDLNYPVPNNFGVACWAKFYPPHEVGVNQLVDCIGIMTDAPIADRSGFELIDESKLQGIPAPSAPRFHAILVQPLDEGNPLVPLDPELREARRFELYESLPAIRSQLIGWMAAVLGGDTLSAEYLLCNIISRPFVRSDLETLGHIPINFTHCSNMAVPVNNNLTAASSSSNGMDSSSSMRMSEEMPTDPMEWARSHRGRIEYLLELLCTKRHTIPLDPIYLEMRNMTPYASEESDRLETGELQLPADTHVVIDETLMTEGNLNQRQLSRLQELTTFVQRQVVDYNFGMYTSPFPVDCPVIVISEGRSLFGVTCTLRLDCNLGVELPPLVDDATLDLWRQLIGLFRTADWAPQDETVLQAIEEDFVSIRQSPGNDYLTPELFSHWNALARASAISFGESALTRERWDYIKSLESSRLQRL